MQNNNLCGNYNIDGTFTQYSLKIINEKFSNSQSTYIELDKIAKPTQANGSCNPYDPYYPYDKCVIENNSQYNICSTFN